MKFLKQIIKLYIVQTLLYLIAKIFESNPILLNSKIDDLIPFVSLFVYFYISWYVLIILVPYLLSKYNIDNYKRYIAKTFMCFIICLIIYLIIPTTVFRPDFKVTNLSSLLVSVIYHFDTPAYNCMPSLHCILSFLYVYSVINIKMPNKYKITIIILSILIILSTLFIKQHVLIDVITGFIVSLIWFIPTSNLNNKILKILN